MTVLDCSPEEIDGAIRRFEAMHKQRRGSKELEAEAEHLAQSGELFAYIPLIADRLREAEGGSEQFAVLFTLLHLGLNVGMFLSDHRRKRGAEE